MAESHLEAPEQVRGSRVEASRRSRRPIMIALSVLGVALVAGLAAGGWWMWQRWQTRPLERLVVVGESTLEDGTTVGGLIAVIEPDGGVLRATAVDSGEEAAIPGTSYDRVRDALAMGGPEEVVSVVVGDDQKSTAWIVLDERAWAQLIDRTGKVEIALPEATTVFTGEELFRFSKGSKMLSGDELVALVMGADALETSGTASLVRLDASRAVAGALIENPDVAREILTAPGVTSSSDAEAVAAFLSAGQ